MKWNARQVEMRPRYRLIPWLRPQRRRKHLCRTRLMAAPEFAGEIETVGQHPMRLEGNIYWLCCNPSEYARRTLMDVPKHRMYLSGTQLSSNPAEWAGAWLSRNMKTVSWWNLCANGAPWTSAMLEANLDKLTWANVSRIEFAWAEVLLRREDLKYVDWWALSLNPAAWAGAILRANISKVNRSGLCSNPSEWARAMIVELKCASPYDLQVNRAPWVVPRLEAMEAQSDRATELYFHWNAEIARNPGIWTYDYVAMAEQMAPLRNEIVAFKQKEVGGEIKK
jgi:hypothetical protein